MPTIEINDLTRTPEGFVKGRARVTGVSVLDYTEVHGVHIYRPESEVFDPESIESLKGIPLTLGHPPGGVDDSNARELSHGSTGSDVQRDGDSLTVDFSIWTDWVAEDVYMRHKSGQRVQFSVGARGQPEMGAGVYDGLAYQAILRRIRYNHLAILDYRTRGRYPITEITDQKAKTLFISDAQLISATKKTEVHTVKIKLPNGAEIDVSDADAHHLNNHLTEHAGLKSQLSEKTGALKTAEKQLNDARAAVPAPDAQQAAVSARLTLAMEALPLLDSVEISDLVAMSDREIHESVLLQDGYTADELKTEDDATVRGMYRQLLKTTGEKQSASFLDAAAKTAAKTQVTQGGHIINDAFSAARAKLAEATAARYRGGAKNAN